MSEYHGDEPLIEAERAIRQARIDDYRADNEHYADLPQQTVTNAAQIQRLSIEMIKTLAGFAEQPLATYLLDADIIVTKARQLRAEVERMGK